MDPMTEPPAEPPIRVFVVDDHPSYRAVAGAVVEATDGFELVGSAGSAAEAVTAVLASSPRPDLVLLDVNLGDGNGVDVAAAIAEARSSVKVVFVSALARHDLPTSAAACGAAGYLPKLELSPITLPLAWSGAYDWVP
jgi:DNA-binding NarL/FixJ family response regulator